MSMGTSASGGVPDATLLIQDLLSPAWTVLPSTTPQLITLHLSTLDLNNPGHLTLITSISSCISTSPSLWRGQASPSSSSRGPVWKRLNWKRANEVYHALLQGCLYRASETTKEFGSGWKGRRMYASYLDAYLKGIQDDEEPTSTRTTMTNEVRLKSGSTSSRTHPVVRLLIASASLAALQSIKLRQDKLYVGGSALMGRAHQTCLEAWNEYFREEEQDTRLSAAAATEWNGSVRTDEVTNDIPSWLAAQTLPTFPIDELASGPVSSLIYLLSTSFSSCFASGTLFDSLPCDVSKDPEGLTWTVPSASHDHLSTLSQAPLFKSLGPLSRALGRLIEAAAIAARTSTPSSSPLHAVKSLGAALERVVTRAQRGWAATAWSDSKDESEMSPSTRSRTEPWTLLKSLLFAITLIDSSLLVIVEPRPEVIPTRLQLDLAALAVRILHKSYFITIRFGTDGFSAWRGVWVGLVEVVSQDTRERIESLMKEMEPSKMGAKHSREVERSETTFYLNSAEQLMKKMSDEYVEEKVLTTCQPYLEDAEYRDTFESAHSVLLAIFANQKRMTNDLALWYTRLLLHAYPKLMSAAQLRLAFTTVVRCASTKSDALAWYCISELINSIGLLPSSRPQPTAPVLPSNQPATSSDSTNSNRDFDDDSTRLDETSSLSPLELKALTLERGHLLLTLIDQTTSVNLVLLRKLLDEIWVLIREEKDDITGDAKGGEGMETGKQALIKVLFATLGEGLDATKREEGVRYWLERREELVE